MDQKPLILISNDDGIWAKGIQSLIHSIRPLGDLFVVAPDGPRSGMSGAITSTLPLRVSLLEKESGLVVYTCSGTPVDCVKIAINELMDRKPDLVISGINHGSNSAICVHYSGTMGAAIEGCIFGIPSFGISLTDHSLDADFKETGFYAQVIAKKILNEGMHRGICLNVNVPNICNVKGMKICRQTEGQWAEEFMKSKDASDKDIYWLTGVFENQSPDDELTDEWALKSGYVSIVTTRIDLTAYEIIDQLKHWELANEKLEIRN